MNTDPATVADIKRRQAAGEGADMADLRSSGRLITASGGHGTEWGGSVQTIGSPDEAQVAVDERVAEGSDYIKVIHDDRYHFRSIDNATLAATVAAAHRRGKLAVASGRGSGRSSSPAPRPGRRPTYPATRLSPSGHGATASSTACCPSPTTPGYRRGAYTSSSVPRGRGTASRCRGSGGRTGASCSACCSPPGRSRARSRCSSTLCGSNSARSVRCRRQRCEQRRQERWG
jgi:hypothetical protein